MGSEMCIRDRMYAAKIIPKKDKHGVSTKQCIDEEKKILDKLDGCEYIARMEEFFEEEENYIIVMEYLTGNDLMSIIKDKREIHTE